MDCLGRWFKFRSGWELEFAQWLDSKGLTWEYEAHVLLPSTERRYTPDFWVREGETYVDIKGSQWSVQGCEQAVSDAGTLC